MIVINQEREYEALPKNIISDNRLSCKSKILYFCFLSGIVKKANKTEIKSCFLETFEEIEEATKELKKHGYIEYSEDSSMVTVNV